VKRGGASHWVGRFIVLGVSALGAHMLTSV
jgi:hypothetical protein